MVTEVALVAFQASEVVPPRSMTVGLAEMVAVG
jgi:hypothetical protein